ncbi:unnamed protein product [Meloidogyne enterolobii]|uniref:Uncharacterized protein n=1 Tax=Meloidogyne enterolobii TaxID=390850 RepID=A0ACB1AFH5_MELEN
MLIVKFNQNSVKRMIRGFDTQTHTIFYFNRETEPRRKLRGWWLKLFGMKRWKSRMNLLYIFRATNLIDIFRAEFV